MRNECVIIDANNVEKFNRCDFCNFKEHVDTLGVVSVDPLYDDLWFCSMNCLYNKKYDKKTKEQHEAEQRKRKNKHKRQKT